MPNKLTCLFVVTVAILFSASAKLAVADPLFKSDEIIDITIRAPLGEMRKARDKDQKYQGSLEHAGARYDIELSVRGNKRLNRRTCTYPPLWIDFEKDQSDGTVFEHQKHTKLVVLCKNSNTYRDYLRAEYLIYKMYNQLTPMSFDVRWVNATYIEEDGESRTEPAFIIERKNRLAKRVKMETVDLQRIDYENLDPRHSALTNLFSYVVANPDFSIVSGAEGSCCHNAKLFTDGSGTYTPVLYDFDNTGLIAASYAQPSPALKIKKVTQRIFRGYCLHNAELSAARNDILEAAPGFLAMLAEDPMLSESFKKRSTKYLTRSIEIISDDENYAKRVLDKCRGSA